MSCQVGKDVDLDALHVDCQLEPYLQRRGIYSLSTNTPKKYAIICKQYTNMAVTCKKDAQNSRLYMHKCAKKRRNMQNILRTSAGASERTHRPPPPPPPAHTTFRLLAPPPRPPSLPAGLGAGRRPARRPPLSTPLRPAARRVSDR